MDAGNILSGGVAGGIIAVIFVLYKVLKHSSCSSQCCSSICKVKVDLTPEPSPVNQEAFLKSVEVHSGVGVSMKTENTPAETPPIKIVV